MDILDLLRSDGSLTINKSLIQKLKDTKVVDDREKTKSDFRPAGGLVTAAILSELISRYKYHEKEDKLVNIKGNKKEKYGVREWFYITHGKLEQLIGVSSSQQDLAIDALEKIGLITKKLIGIPAKRHFKINEDVIVDFIFDKGQFSKKKEPKTPTKPRGSKVPAKREPREGQKGKQCSSLERSSVPAKREPYNNNYNNKNNNVRKGNLSEDEEQQILDDWEKKKKAKQSAKSKPSRIRQAMTDIWKLSDINKTHFMTLIEYANKLNGNGEGVDLVIEAMKEAQMQENPMFYCTGRKPSEGKGILNRFVREGVTSISQLKKDNNPTEVNAGGGLTDQELIEMYGLEV